MDAYKRRFFYMTLVVCSIFVCTYFFNIEFPVQDEYQTIIHQLAGGHFSDGPVMDYYFLAYIGYSYIITLLSGFIGFINWVGVIEIGLLMLGMFIYLRKVLKISSETHDNIWFLGGCLLIAMLTFLDGFTVISYSRPALLLCGISLYTLLFEESSDAKKWLFCLLFLMGLLLRPESGLGMIVYISVAYVIFRFDILFVLNRIKWPLLMVGIYMLVVSLLINTSDNFLFKIEPEVEYKFMQGYVKQLSADATPVDAIKYFLAINGFIFDPSVLSAEYLRSIQTTPDFSQIFSNALGVVGKIIYYWDFYFVSTGILMTGVFVSIYCRRFDILGKILLFSAITFLLFVALRINSGVGHRHIHPFFLMYNLLIFTYVVRQIDLEKLKNPMIWSCSLSVLVFSLFVYVGNTASWSAALVNSCKISEQRRTLIEKKYHGELIVGTLDSMKDIFDRRFSFLNKKDFNNQYMLFEFYNFSMLPPYDRYMKRILNDNHYNIKHAYKYFCVQHALYFSSEKKVQLVQTYLNLVYKETISFKKEKGRFSDEPDATNLYRISCN